MNEAVARRSRDTAVKTVAALLLSAGSALAAGNGSITIRNDSEGKIRINSYDWNDSARWNANESTDVDPGQSATVTCRKDLWNKDSPGCQLRIEDAVNGDDLLLDKRRNGAYIFTGSALRDLADSVGIFPGHMTDCLSTAQDKVLLDNGNLYLMWQADGNLVLYRKDGGGPVWASGTNGKADRACFQNDGNFVLYGGSAPVWATDSANRGVSMVLQSDCNLVVGDGNGGLVWQSGTHCYLP